jgi:hypothetical protein
VPERLSTCTKGNSRVWGFTSAVDLQTSSSLCWGYRETGLKKLPFPVPLSCLLHGCTGKCPSHALSSYCYVVTPSCCLPQSLELCITCSLFLIVQGLDKYPLLILLRPSSAILSNVTHPNLHVWISYFILFWNLWLSGSKLFLYLFPCLLSE